MTAIPQPAAPTSAFAATYDAWNRLISLAGVASYSYDGLNRRTTKTVSGVLRDFYYSSQWQILEERIGGTTAADRQFVWGLRYIDDLVLRDRATERLYALQDANWNVIAIVDTSGVVQERYRYTAYGLPAVLNPDFSIRSGGSSFGWETLYCGYRWDSESGLYLARNRYLNSLLGLWITRDPIGFDGGNLNLYGYVGVRPVVKTDPTGLYPPPPAVRITPCGDFSLTAMNVLNATPGVHAPGWTLVFDPADTNMTGAGPCACPGGNFKLSQTIERVDSGIPPHQDVPDTPLNPIPAGTKYPDYFKCSGRGGPLTILDAPGAGSGMAFTYKLTACAICDLGPGAETVIGCANFIFENKTGNITLTRYDTTPDPNSPQIGIGKGPWPVFPGQPGAVWVKVYP